MRIYLWAICVLYPSNQIIYFCYACKHLCGGFLHVLIPFPLPNQCVHQGSFSCQQETCTPPSLIKEEAFTGSTIWFHSQEGLEPDFSDCQGQAQALSSYTLASFFLLPADWLLVHMGKTWSLPKTLSAPSLHANSKFLSCHFESGRKVAISLLLLKHGMGRTQERHGLKKYSVRKHL